MAAREALAVAVGAVLVAAAFVLPRLHRGIRPRLDVGQERFGTHAGAAPIFGGWDTHASWGTGPAILARRGRRCVGTRSSHNGFRGGC